MIINDSYQVGGDHYISLSVQPLEAMRSWMSDAELCGYLKGNVIKYLARDKGDRLTDYQKAAHYLQMLIEQTEHSKP